MVVVRNTFYVIIRATCTRDFQVINLKANKRIYNIYFLTNHLRMIVMIFEGVHFLRDELVFFQELNFISKCFENVCCFKFLKILHLIRANPLMPLLTLIMYFIWYHYNFLFSFFSKWKTVKSSNPQVNTTFSPGFLGCFSAHVWCIHCYYGLYILTQDVLFV